MVDLTSGKLSPTSYPMNTLPPSRESGTCLWVFAIPLTQEEIKQHPRYADVVRLRANRHYDDEKGLDPVRGAVLGSLGTRTRKVWKPARLGLVEINEAGRLEFSIVLADNSNLSKLPNAEQLEAIKNVLCVTKDLMWYYADDGNVQSR
ncbi:hypothetical protein D9758_007942 [Tetrapyrgos nigripes]|uniref:Uncharacterized protein n=1 Tax=Tetrapyrgos nigripes TaxID=182062 RepID=A0A8H5FX41_9AGAR|nr:hypothetical protein D9758_007942 [Tetrapyrgos nigripes]